MINQTQEVNQHSDTIVDEELSHVFSALPRNENGHEMSQNDNGHEVEIWETGETLYTKLKRLTDVFGITAQKPSKLPPTVPIPQAPLGDHSYCNATDNPSLSPTNASEFKYERNFPEENHKLLVSLSSILQSVKATVDNNGTSIRDLSSRIAKVENKVDNSVLELHEQINLEQNNIIDLGEQVQSIEVTLRRYTDDQLCSLKNDLVPMIGESQNRLENQVKSQESALYEKMDETVKDLIKSDAVSTFIEKMVDTQIDAKQKIANTRLIQFGNKLNASEVNLATIKNNLNQLYKQCQQERDLFNAKTKELEKMIADLRKRLDKTPASNPPSQQNQDRFELNKDEHGDLGARFESMAKRIDFIEYQSEQNGRLANSLDLRSRRNNVVIDQLSEDHNENTLDKLNTILDHALANSNPGIRAEISIMRAYRLGTIREGSNYTRRVFVELANSRSKDLVIEYAAKIVKSGNNGRPYYINDDLPEKLKRRKADIHKYVNYLKKWGHRVEKAGDGRLDNRRAEVAI